MEGLIELIDKLSNILDIRFAINADNDIDMYLILEKMCEYGIVGREEVDRMKAPNS